MVTCPAGGATCVAAPALISTVVTVVPTAAETVMDCGLVALYGSIARFGTLMGAFAAFVKMALTVGGMIEENKARPVVVPSTVIGKVTLNPDVMVA